ncbi:cytochrome P450 6k1-like isoform X1 [Pieris rapae]|uniref:cytochrome P450 6k1-like isoform X1 n=2 Tax=Pieris rapae TaxID=64459 RepID=UPI001E27F9A7|nr:cytochrome P450 6k1-like isoform X1 [Pieris rapae]
MIAFFSIVIVVCIITWGYFRWVNLSQFWKRRGVPHLPPHPILGSLTFLQRKNPATWMIEMYQNFNTPYVGIWLFWRPALIINSPEIAKNVLVKDFDYFRDRFLSSGSSDPVGGLNLFTTNDPLWSSLRRRLTSTFTSSKLKAMQPLIDTKTSELVKRIQSTEDKTKISLRYLFTDFTTDIFATAAFGIKTNATLTGKDPMRTITAAFMKFDLYRGLNWISIFFFPKLVDIFRFSLFPKSATDHFRRVFNIVSQQRLSKRNSESKDFLDVLLKMKEEGANAEAISDDIIIAQAAIFLFGGFETSGSILSFATYELAFHQDVQEKLYNELKEVQMQSKDGRLDITKLAELPYINAVAKETLRKYVPMGWLDRVAAMDYKVDDNLTIPAGTPIYVNAIGMQHDSNIYPDPETFNPDRFLPENAKNIQPYTYLPFGDGPRHCIGKRFAQISVRHGIANLILNYQIVPVPGAPKPNEVEFEKQGLFLVPGQHLYVNFVSRNQD